LDWKENYSLVENVDFCLLGVLWFKALDRKLKDVLGLGASFSFAVIEK
jgi:hypothetical protein